MKKKEKKEESSLFACDTSDGGGAANKMAAAAAARLKVRHRCCLNVLVCVGGCIWCRRYSSLQDATRLSQALKVRRSVSRAKSKFRFVSLPRDPS